MTANQWQRPNDPNEERGKLIRRANIIKQLKPFINNKSIILDIGCGDGFVGTALKKLYPNLIYEGMDIDKSAKAILNKQGFEFYNSMEEVLKQDKAYNMIIMTDLVEHLDYKTLTEYVKHIELLMEYNGEVLITVPNADNCFFLNNFFWNNPEHIRPYTEESIRTLFYDEFDLIKKKYFCNFIDPMKIILNLAVFRTLPKTSALYLLKYKYSDNQECCRSWLEKRNNYTDLK